MTYSEYVFPRAEVRPNTKYPGDLHDQFFAYLSRRQIPKKLEPVNIVARFVALAPTYPFNRQAITIPTRMEQLHKAWDSYILADVFDFFDLPELKIQSVHHHLHVPLRIARIHLQAAKMIMAIFTCLAVGFPLLPHSSANASLSYLWTSVSFLASTIISSQICTILLTKILTVL